MINQQMFQGLQATSVIGSMNQTGNLNQERKPPTPIPEQTFRDHSEFENEALKHTRMINTYIKEIEQLRDDKEMLLVNQDPYPKDDRPIHPG